MPGYVAGSVTAKIELDTTDFDKKIEALKGKVDDLKVALQKNGLADVSKQIKKYQEALDSQKKTIDDLTERISEYKKQLKSLREGHNQNTNDIKKETEQLKLESKALDNATKSAKRYELATERIGKRNTYTKPKASDFSEVYTKVNPEIEAQVGLEGLKMAYHEYDRQQKVAIQKDKEYWQTRQSNMRNAMEAMVSSIRIMAIEQVKSFATTQTGYNGYLKTLSKVTSAYGKVSNVAPKATQSSKTFARTMAEVTSKYSLFQTRLERVKGELEEVTVYIGKASQVLKTFDFQLLALCDTEAKAYENTLKLASAMHRMTVQGTENWKGRSQFGYSSYISSLSKINQALQKQKQLEASIKAQKLDQYYAKVGSASTKYWNQIRSGTVNLNTYKANINSITKALEQQTQRTQRLANAQYKLFQKYHTTNLNTYKANMSEINQKLAEQTTQTGKVEQGIRKTGTAMVKSAHSGRILSNTLYQIRGALLSLKMIFTAMGGMALWGFGMEIAEGIKTTFAAKNEMEEQLKANAKVGASGLQVFNRELDNTISKFKKVNKYALGETVSSLGLEFELNTRQMGKAMDIVAMIQSEYVRAGRTQEEAALAVKDILQGEFQRLSRETGVGKEELLSYGWSGDNKDIDSILKAVKKAGEDRNWDLFAAKATSLNDVIQITQSRFEEFGADLLQTISPMIVSAFNTLSGGLDSLKKAFDGLGSFGKNTVFAGLATGLAALIGTGLPMVTKGMGLADVATIGWYKSLGTAVLNLNKAEVAQYGFRKALAATITGTKASELANVRTTKALMGRLLGVKQSVLAEHGYMTALVQSRGVLMNHTGATNIAKISSMSFAQKLAYLTNNMKLQDAQSLKTSTAIRKVATSWRVLRTAMLGVIGIAAVAWYSSMATWADTVRNNIDGLNEVIDNGKSMVKEAASTVNDYETALSKLTKGTVEYKKAANNLEVAKANQKDIENANKLAQTYKKQNKEMKQNIATAHKLQMARSYELAGIDRTKASEMASGWTNRVKAGEQNWIDSMNIYNDRLYKSNQHINEHIELMNKANLSEKQKLKYIDEYSLKAEDVAEKWKKFNQGDMTAGAYALLGELQLMWIDLWNDKDFINFWNSVKKTFNELKPTLIAIKDALVDLGHSAMQFFSTDVGRWIGTIGIFGTAVGLVVGKLSKWITGNNITIEALKKLGGVLKERISDWAKYKKNKTEAESPAPTTGGTTGKGGEAVKFTEQLKKDAQNYVRAAAAIFAIMVLVTEAIYLIQAPMWALAETGKTFKAKEASIQAGIDGLKLIAPTVIAILVPVMALIKVMDMWGDQVLNLKTLAATFVGIAAGLLLVTEAIVMLKAPMWALAEVGKDFAIGKADIQGGITAMNTLGEALRALVPFIPIFAGGIALAAAVIIAPEFGLLAAGATVVGIAAGMLLVAEAIEMLRAPLEAIRDLGNSYTDLSGVKQGATVIKTCAEALVYVEDATRSLALVKWELLASSLADVIAAMGGHNLGDDLVKLAGEDGFLPKMNEFAKAFNKIEFTAVNADKAAAMKTAAESLNSINDALSAAKTAIANLPAEFKNSGEGLNSVFTSYDAETGKLAPTAGAVATTETTSYFDQLKQPIEDLGKFMEWFNSLTIPEPNADKVAALTASATMVEQVNSAVEKVKTAMGNIGMGNLATNFAQMTGGTQIPQIGGIGAIAGMVGGALGMGGSGDYKSSIGSQLYEMEMVLTDLSTFNSKVATIGSTNGGGAFTEGSGVNAEALTSMVTAVSNAINQLNSTLSSAVPQVKANATAIGTGIKAGVTSGLNGLQQAILPPFITAMNILKSNALTYGKGAGGKLKEGFKAEAKLKETAQAEVDYTLQYLDGKKGDFEAKGEALGAALSTGFQRKGLKQMSPGLMARAALQEMYYMQDSLDVGLAMLPQKAIALGNALTSNFNPQLGLGGLSVDDLSQFQYGLDQVSYMAQNTNMQTSTAFNSMNTTVATDMAGMTTSVNGSLNSINTNATTSYGNIVNTTRTSLKNMQSQTTKNIGAIRTSWKGMQNALIASAENIRQQTATKIHSLESNMASFWRKIQNPANLLSGAGNPHMAGHTIRRRGSSSHVSSPKTSKRLLSRTPSAGNSRLSGISNSFRQTGDVIKNSKLRGKFAEYLQCLLNGGNCMAGGWNFNWSKDIQKTFLKWHTHFGDIYDQYLTVGKFENDDFPVKGIKEIALNYIEDAIGRTKYDFYWDYRYDPLTAWNRGAFNCMDGARLVIALANAFGFPGGSIGHTTWDGLGHGYAIIPGLGNIDATAIQGHYGLTASKVRYAGNHTMSRNAVKNDPMGNVINGGVTVNVTIEGDVDNPEETGRKIGEEASKTIFDILKRSPATGL